MKGGKRWQKVVKGGGGRDMCCGRAGREKDGRKGGKKGDTEYLEG